MIRNTIYAILLLCALSACGSNDDEEKDMQMPVISGQNITANPIDCQQYQRGSVIPFHYLLLDNKELGAYNIEIHNNFDHHTHGTTSAECAMEEEKKPQKPWIYNQDFTIPADIDAGDYHFMVRLTDHAGWQQLHAVAIKIVE